MWLFKSKANKNNFLCNYQTYKESNFQTEILNQNFRVAGSHHVTYWGREALTTLPVFA